MRRKDSRSVPNGVGYPQCGPCASHSNHQIPWTFVDLHARHPQRCPRNAPIRTAPALGMDGWAHLLGSSGSSERAPGYHPSGLRAHKPQRKCGRCGANDDQLADELVRRLLWKNFRLRRRASVTPPRRGEPPPPDFPPLRDYPTALDNTLKPSHTRVCARCHRWAPIHAAQKLRNSAPEG